MAKVIEPLYDEKKLSDYLKDKSVKKVLLIFWHGLGDLIMFLNPYLHLQNIYPDVSFLLAPPEGLGFEDVRKDICPVSADDLDHLEEKKEYDLIAKIHFSMSESQTKYTKGEWCCIHELGIEPVNTHHPPEIITNRLIGVHFNNTCLPGVNNPDKEIAEIIWNEILEAGCVPIETHFQHIFHNPVNEKFDFIDCSVRKAKPQISTLAGLIKGLKGFIGVSSGNFHIALSLLKPEQVLYLEKGAPLECYTKQKVAKVNINEGKYKKGEVNKWLNTLIS